ncbi:IS66 family transposase [Photorhabdus temperata subsp. temperata M1021]|nr:IS66 family transposase [Photorhabdus temperata subsp. temperata M1021]
MTSATSASLLRNTPVISQKCGRKEAAFVFCNKARSRLKVLRWDRHGVWLCTRRLHRAHFVWPKQGERSWVMTPAQFNWLIRGIHWQQVEGDDLSGWRS